MAKTALTANPRRRPTTRRSRKEPPKTTRITNKGPQTKRSRREAGRGRHRECPTGMLKTSEL